MIMFHYPRLFPDQHLYIPGLFLQDMLLSLQRPISILGEVTTVNMSFHASYQSKDGQSMLLGGFGIGFFRVLF